VQITIITRRLLSPVLLMFSLAHLPGCQFLKLQEPEPPTAIYIGVQANSPTHTSLAQDLLYQVARKTHANQWIVIDLMRSEKGDNLFSSPPTRRAIQEVMTHFEAETESSDRAIIQSFNHLVELAIEKQGRSFHGYLVTSGTSNPATLNELRSLATKLADQKLPNVHVYVVGLSANNRIKMSEAMKPLARCIQFAGESDTEWVQLVKQF
jgi:hypothetical protein